MNEERNRLAWIVWLCWPALLATVFCAVGYLAGHRVGYDEGYSKASDEYGGPEMISAGRYYDVSDFVIPLKEAAE
ncbi:MAG: hypothetical protein HOL01_13315 [Planctomycetaceae bacterium]|jgi:hypothetical protein|nr:hypothetical protein [Planctomycetaceae bacterium]MBT6485854.1 hypothetical protein [Planctomycetaceae bacterium]MBT6495521.1 hypothetical protein [Planctomycetaceae bacterium]